MAIDLVFLAIGLIAKVVVAHGEAPCTWLGTDIGRHFRGSLRRNVLKGVGLGGQCGTTHKESKCNSVFHGMRVYAIWLQM